MKTFISNRRLFLSILCSFIMIFSFFMISCGGGKGDRDGGGGDTESPTVPANLTAAADSTSQINLEWNASIDNVGVTGYKI
jgi:hypothetical protein